MYLKSIFILILCCLGMSCHSQDVDRLLDSLENLIEEASHDSIRINILGELAQHTLYEKPHKSASYCQDLLELSINNRDYEAGSSAYLSLFNAQLYFGAKSDTLLQTVKNYEDYVANHLGFEYQHFVYWIYALYYSNIDQTDREIEAYIKALKIAQQINVTADIEGALTGNIANVLLKQNKYDEAEYYLNQSVQLLSDTIGLAESFFNLGRIKLNQTQKEEALFSFSKAKSFYKVGGDNKGVAIVLIEEAKLYDDLNDSNKAKQLLSEAEAIISDNDIGSLVPLVTLNLAEHYYKLGDYKKARQFGEKAYKEIKTYDTYDLLESTYEVLHKTYDKLGAYEKAYSISIISKEYLDSLNRAEVAVRVERLKTQYEVEQKEIENKFLKAESEADKKKIQAKNIGLLASLLGFLLVLSWGVVVLRSNRRKQKYNVALEKTVAERTSDLEKLNKELRQANYELKTFNHIASHDLKEPIRNIGSRIGLIRKKLPEELRAKFDDYFDTIAFSTNQLYTVVEDFSRYIHFSKNEDLKIESVDLDKVVESLRVTLIDKITDKQGQITNSNLGKLNTNASMIFIILKNLVENGLKFNKSEKPEVNISLVDKEHNIDLIIKDNGIGIDADSRQEIFNMYSRLHSRKEFEGTGIGLAIVKLLVDKLKGTIAIKGEATGGTQFILSFPK